MSTPTRPTCDAETFLAAPGPAAVPLRICCAAALLRTPGSPFPCLAELLDGLDREPALIAGPPEMPGADR